MIEQNVQVVRCQDESIWIRLGSQTGCSACDDGKGCGAGVFAKLFQRKPVVLELPRKDLRVVPGQMITLGFSEQVYLKLVFASYGWPLLAAIAGGFAGNSLASWLQLSAFQTDLSTLVLGLLGGGILMHVSRKRFTHGTGLIDLQSMDYFPAKSPNMCSRANNDPVNKNGSEDNRI